MTSEVILEAINLKRDYKQGESTDVLSVIKGIDLQIVQGEKLRIDNRNGELGRVWCAWVPTLLFRLELRSVLPLSSGKKTHTVYTHTVLTCCNVCKGQTKPTHLLATRVATPPQAQLLASDTHEGPRLLARMSRSAACQLARAGRGSIDRQREGGGRHSRRHEEQEHPHK